MDKLKKSDASDDLFRSHCFPVFHGLTPVNEGEEDTSCNLFRPTYECHTEESTSRPSAMLSSNPDANQNDDTAEQRQKSFDQGVIAGQKDAHCLVQQELTPGLEGFALSTNQLNEHLEIVTEASVRNIIQLATGIVHRVIGESISLGDENMTSVYQEIRDAMRRAYSISLQINADDHNCLSSILKCSPELTLSGDGVQLTGDDQVPKGALCRDEEAPGDSFKPIVQKLTQLLDDIQPS